MELQNCIVLLHRQSPKCTTTHIGFYKQARALLYCRRYNSDVNIYATYNHPNMSAKNERNNKGNIIREL